MRLPGLLGHHRRCRQQIEPFGVCLEHANRAMTPGGEDLEAVPDPLRPGLAAMPIAFADRSTSVS